VIETICQINFEEVDGVIAGIPFDDAIEERAWPNCMAFMVQEGACCH